MRAIVFGLALVLLRLADCTDAKVTATVGEDIVLSATSAPIPIALRQDTGTGPVIASVPCGGTCPSGAGVTVQCVASVCDPDPIEVVVPVALVDFEAEAADLFSRIDAVELLDLTYAVSANTLTFATGSIDLYWGPASATGIGDPGVQRLGTFPAVPARATSSGEVALDAAATDALSNYVSNVAPQIRLFARTSLDFDPGDPFPEGEATAGVVLVIRIVGHLL